MQTYIKFLALSFVLTFNYAFSSPKMVAPIETLTIPFYSEVLNIQYPLDIKQEFTKKLEETSIVNFYEQLEDTNYEPLLASITKYQSKLRLNDWLVYELTQKIIEEVYINNTRKEKVLANWFLLSKLGYDTRLAFLKNEVFIYVRSIDDIYETPLIEDGGNRFVGLPEMQYKRKSKNKAVYLLNFLPAPNGKDFTFSLADLPYLKADKIQKKFKFDWEETSYEIAIQCDKTLVEVMKKYPVIGETDYIETPFSGTLKKSLLPQIQAIITGKSTKETLEILTTFTRSAFKYREDESYFGKSKPMIRDEVFFYPYSDCEDRSALFYGLVDELLGLPMILVAFPDHLTVAVALEEPIGPSIRYKGKKFYICDPTGPSNSSEIGKVPKGYEKQSFEILADNL